MTFLKKTLNLLADLWLYKIPFAIIFISLIYVGLSIISVYTSEQSLKDLYTIYFSLVALTGSFSGILFSYASATDDLKERNDIKKIGEAFLYATINYVIVLLLTWVAINMRNSEHMVIKYLSQFILALSYGYVTYAAVSLYYGLTKTFKLIEPTYYKVFDWK